MAEGSDPQRELMQRLCVIQANAQLLERRIHRNQIAQPTECLPVLNSILQASRAMTSQIMALCDDDSSPGGQPARQEG